MDGHTEGWMWKSVYLSPHPIPSTHTNTVCRGYNHTYYSGKIVKVFGKFSQSLSLFYQFGLTCYRSEIFLAELELCLKRDFVVAFEWCIGHTYSHENFMGTMLPDSTVHTWCPCMLLIMLYLRHMENTADTEKKKKKKKKTHTKKKHSHIYGTSQKAKTFLV